MFRLAFFVAVLFAGWSSAHAQWEIEESPTTTDPDSEEGDKDVGHPPDLYSDDAQPVWRRLNLCA